MITLPPVQVRRRPPAIARRINDVLQRIIPALLAGAGGALATGGNQQRLPDAAEHAGFCHHPVRRSVLSRRAKTTWGIGWNVLASLQRVAVGFGPPALVGIPLGFSDWPFHPFLTHVQPPADCAAAPGQPIGPLPIGLLLPQKAEPSSSWTILSVDLSMVINTAEGVRQPYSAGLPQCRPRVAAF